MSLPGKLPDLGAAVPSLRAGRPSSGNDDNPSNAELKGDALVTALQPMNWDPSVKSIIAFPFVGLCASEPAGHRWGAPENQVRSGLSAGAKRIRTLSPTLVRRPRQPQGSLL